MGDNKDTSNSDYSKIFSKPEKSREEFLDKIENGNQQPIVIDKTKDHDTTIQLDSNLINYMITDTMSKALGDLDLVKLSKGFGVAANIISYYPVVLEVKEILENKDSSYTKVNEVANIVNRELFAYTASAVATKAVAPKLATLGIGTAKALGTVALAPLLAKAFLLAGTGYVAHTLAKEIFGIDVPKLLREQDDAQKKELAVDAQNNNEIRAKPTYYDMMQGIPKNNNSEKLNFFDEIGFVESIGTGIVSLFSAGKDFFSNHLKSLEKENKDKNQHFLDYTPPKVMPYTYKKDFTPIKKNAQDVSKLDVNIVSTDSALNNRNSGAATDAQQATEVNMNVMAQEGTSNNSIGTAGAAQDFSKLDMKFAPPEGASNKNNGTASDAQTLPELTMNLGAAKGAGSDNSLLSLSNSNRGGIENQNIQRETLPAEIGTELSSVKQPPIGGYNSQNGNSAKISNKIQIYDNRTTTEQQFVQSNEPKNVSNCGNAALARSIA